MKKTFIAVITALVMSLSMSAPVSAEEESTSPVSFSGMTIGVSCGGSVNPGDC